VTDFEAKLHSSPLLSGPMEWRKARPSGGASGEARPRERHTLCAGRLSGLVSQNRPPSGRTEGEQTRERDWRESGAGRRASGQKH